MKKLTKIMSLLLSMVLVLSVLGACNNNNNNDDDIDYTDLSVRDYVGENGIVTAANPYAAKAGLDILKAGGNAFDAAVAVSFALGVAECDATGLGGGGIMVAYNVNTKKSIYYNFREFAPGNVSTESSTYYTADGTSNIGNKYCKVTAVPTQLAGLLTILSEQGTLTRQEVMAPAIKLAKEGVTVTPELANNISNYAGKVQPASEVENVLYDSDGFFLTEGATLVQTDLANLLTKISNEGKEAFYTGEVAQTIVDTAQQYGSEMTLDDLLYAMNNYPRTDSKVIEGTYKGYDILTASSPSTGGVMLIEMLNMLEAYESSGKTIASLGHNSAEYINLIATVEQLAYGDKEQYLADTGYQGVTDYSAGLMNKSYAQERIGKYKVGQAYLGAATVGENAYGDPSRYMANDSTSYFTAGTSDDHCSTTSFSIIDKQGNIVTVTQTINNFFGSGVVPTGLGFFLNDEMRDFNLKDENSINFVAPYKQPASYMAPTVILKDDKPYATIGTPGGSRIPSALLQVILNMIEFDMDIQTAIASPRCFCFTTSSSDLGKTTKTINIENSLKTLKDELVAMGYEIVYSDGGGELNSYFGGVQGIKVENNNYHGGADPRRDGKALGY